MKDNNKFNSPINNSYSNQMILARNYSKNKSIKIITGVKDDLNNVSEKPRFLIQNKDKNF